MKRKLTVFAALSLFILMFGACNDPVFYMISEEIEVLKPYIAGSPSNIVLLDGDMFVAAGHNLYRYSDDGGGYKWSISRRYDHRIIQIAGPVNGSLYALFLNDGNNNRFIQQINTGSNMPLGDNKIEITSVIQSMYAANGCLFISALDDDEYETYYSTDGENITLIENTSSNHGRLNGIAHNTTGYFLSMESERVGDKNIGGIFHTADPASPAALIPGSDNGIVGILALEDASVVAVNRNGVLYNVTSASITASGISFPADPQRHSNGALAIVKENGENKLLAGRQDSLQTSLRTGYSYGYLELTLDGDSLPVSGNFIEPDISNFPSSIGRNPVNSIVQGPCGTVFASTQNNGLWSLRPRRAGVISWNSEQ